MNIAPELEALRQRQAPLDMPSGEFRRDRPSPRRSDRRSTGDAAGRTGDARTNRRRTSGRALGAEQTLPPAAPTPAGW